MPEKLTISSIRVGGIEPTFAGKYKWNGVDYYRGKPVFRHKNGCRFAFSNSTCKWYLADQQNRAVMWSTKGVELTAVTWPDPMEVRFKKPKSQSSKHKLTKPSTPSVSPARGAKKKKKRKTRPSTPPAAHQKKKRKKRPATPPPNTKKKKRKAASSKTKRAAKKPKTRGKVAKLKQMASRASKEPSRAFSPDSSAAEEDSASEPAAKPLKASWPTGTNGQMKTLRSELLQLRAENMRLMTASQKGEDGEGSSSGTEADTDEVTGSAVSNSPVKVVPVPPRAKPPRPTQPSFKEREKENSLRARAEAALKQARSKAQHSRAKPAKRRRKIIIGDSAPQTAAPVALEPKEPSSSPPDERKALSPVEPSQSPPTVFIGSNAEASSEDEADDPVPPAAPTPAAPPNQDNQRSTSSDAPDKTDFPVDSGKENADKATEEPPELINRTFNERPLGFTIRLDKWNRPIAIMGDAKYLILKVNKKDLRNLFNEAKKRGRDASQRLRLVIKMLTKLPLPMRVTFEEWREKRNKRYFV